MVKQVWSCPLCGVHFPAMPPAQMHCPPYTEWLCENEQHTKRNHKNREEAEACKKCTCGHLRMLHTHKCWLCTCTKPLTEVV